MGVGRESQRLLACSLAYTTVDLKIVCDWLLTKPDCRDSLSAK